MRSYFERAKDFIEQVFPYIDGMIEPWDIRDMINEFNLDFDRKVKVGNGLSRIALITSDYVVKWDYNPYEVESIGGCENEITLYSAAKAEGFGYLFAEITRVQYRDRNFYIMPRIRGIGNGGWYNAEHFMTDAERDWCNKHKLTDLHCNNYGFRQGRVCIVDYACRNCFSTSSDRS